MLHVKMSARKASRTTSAVADAIEDGVGEARRFAKQGGDAAEEFIDDTTKRLQRHSTETVVASHRRTEAEGHDPCDRCGRSGRRGEELPLRDLVPGDIIKLAAGDS
jgi:hypothetical protein